MSMNTTLRIITAAAMAASLAIAPAANAAPHGHHGHHSGHRGGHRHNAGALIAGLIGGAILANTTNSSRGDSGYSGGGYKAAKRRCASTYDSYDWDSDTIISRGKVRTCKFVRPYL